MAFFKPFRCIFINHVCHIFPSTYSVLQFLATLQEIEFVTVLRAQTCVRLNISQWISPIYHTKQTSQRKISLLTRYFFSVPKLFCYSPSLVVTYFLQSSIITDSYGYLVIRDTAALSEGPKFEPLQLRVQHFTSNSTGRFSLRDRLPLSH